MLRLLLICLSSCIFLLGSFSKVHADINDDDTTDFVNKFVVETKINDVKYVTDYSLASFEEVNRLQESGALTLQEAKESSVQMKRLMENKTTLPKKHKQMAVIAIPVGLLALGYTHFTYPNVVFGRLIAHISGIVLGIAIADLIEPSPWRTEHRFLILVDRSVFPANVKVELTDELIFSFKTWKYEAFSLKK